MVSGFQPSENTLELLGRHLVNDDLAEVWKTNMSISTGGNPELRLKDLGIEEGSRLERMLEICGFSDITREAE